MTLKNKIYFIIFTILEFVGLLFFLGYMAAEPLQAGDQVARAMPVAASGVVPDRFTLVSVLPVVAGDRTVGGLAVYDDTTTSRPADYLELYNNQGGLLAVSWFDEFGIQRMAIDRALVEERDDLEGVFVLLAADDFI